MIVIHDNSGVVVINYSNLFDTFSYQFNKSNVNSFKKAIEKQTKNPMLTTFSEKDKNCIFSSLSSYDWFVE